LRGFEEIPRGARKIPRYGESSGYALPSTGATNEALLVHPNSFLGFFKRCEESAFVWIGYGEDASGCRLGGPYFPFPVENGENGSHTHQTALLDKPVKMTLDLAR
jgi:hypothetical protein